MTFSEENYLKTIYHLTTALDGEVSTNAIAEKMETKASSVTDMLKKLSEKELVNYKKYQGVSLSVKGKLSAKMIVRKHRLWEVFLVDKLQFSWDEVHDIAEQLEHIKSEKLIDKLDAFLEFPEFDPHGDPIPDVNGTIKKIAKLLLSEAKLNIDYLCVGVKDTSIAFLQYLDKQSISLGSRIRIINKEDFDQTLTLELNEKTIIISNKIATNLYISNNSSPTK